MLFHTCSPAREGKKCWKINEPIEKGDIPVNRWLINMAEKEEERSKKFDYEQTLVRYMLF